MKIVSIYLPRLNHVLDDTMISARKNTSDVDVQVFIPQYFNTSRIAGDACTKPLILAS